MIKHLKTVLFLVLCIGIGAGIGRGYIWLSHHWDSPDFSNSLAPPVITGIGDAPAHRGFTLSAAALNNIPAVIQKSHDAFATTIAVEYGPSVTPSALASAVRAAHQKNMFLTLLPAPAFSSQNPFPKPLSEIATMAQSAGVDILCISWLNAPADSAYWRQECQTIRPLYKGQVILAATPEVLPTLYCLDAPDLIGAIGPIPMPRRLPNSPNDVTVQDLRIAWDCALTSIESLARVNSKKIALLHMNVPVNVSARLPAPGKPDQPSANPALQKMLYEALFLETKGRSVYTDLLLFNYEDSAGQPDGPLAISGLPAEMAEAWDPKKPAVVPPPAPPEAFDLPDLPDIDLDNPADVGTDPVAGTAK